MIWGSANRCNMGKGFFDTLKADSTEAAYRVAGTQVIKATKSGLLQVLQRKGINNKYINTVSNFLDTEAGTAGLSTVVGLMLAYFPSFKNNKRAQGLAKEFKVSGLAAAGNLLASKAVQDLLPRFNNLVEMLPAHKKIRVADTLPVYEELEEEKVSIDANRSSVWY